MIRPKAYAGNILRVNLSSGSVGKVPTEDYTQLFLGGRGLAAKIYWDEVPPGIDAFDPENRLLFVTGPITGVAGLASPRWQVCGKSPIHDRFSYCNLGGSWGVQLKFAGYDGLVIHGKSDKKVYLFIDDGHVEIRDATHLVGTGAIECREKLKEELGKNFSIVAVGVAGENSVVFASLVADMDATGSSGLGAVMGSKNLKAIAVKGGGKIDVADPEKVKKLKQRLRLEMKGRAIMVLPSIVNPEKLKKEICYGCGIGCMRSSYEGARGQKGKFMCQSGLFYQTRAQRYYGELNEVPFEANKLCDDYGIDTHTIETMIMWLSRCHQAGLLSDEQTGIPFSKIGSREFIEALLSKISHREGFGDLLAEGTNKAAEALGGKAPELITDYMTWTGYNPVYGARLYITTGLLYATESRLPIQELHEISPLVVQWAMQATGLGQGYLTSDVVHAIAKRFWGSEIAADFSSYEGKALAAVKIQDRQHAKESLILCDFIWPIFHSALSEDHVGDPTLESQICAAVTGRDIDEQGLYKIGERVFNLQRAILAREGHRGREHDCIEEFNYTVPLKTDFGNPACVVPGKDGELLSRKGMVVDREKFEQMKDEYYQIRDWDVANGLQKRSKLEELNLEWVAQKLESEGLLA